MLEKKSIYERLTGTREERCWRRRCLGKAGNVGGIGDCEKNMIYKFFLKRILDIVLSVVGIIILAIPMLVIAIMIKVDSPGPVFFKQKRIGIHKTYFFIIKFRSMPVTAPHDTPTHMMKNAEDILTPFQKTIRRLSIDELPQLFCILTSKMSVIGPRPALWNQDDLIAERDKYGVNDVKPGLTGWAQINGRDELEIPVKAKLDGIYVEKLNSDGFTAFAMDCKCFFGTILSVLKHDGVVEGGTGKLRNDKNIWSKNSNEESINNRSE